MFATSEEQLVMHNEGKKHKRTVALKELTHGHLAGAPTDSATGLLPATHCIAPPMQAYFGQGLTCDHLLLPQPDTIACNLCNNHDLPPEIALNHIMLLDIFYPDYERMAHALPCQLELHRFLGASSHILFSSAPPRVCQR